MKHKAAVVVIIKIDEIKKISNYFLIIDSHINTIKYGFHIFYVQNKIKIRSPSDGHSRVWSSELAKHLQFDLIDTAGMSEDQLRQIPYTVVETNSSKRVGANSLKVHRTTTKDRVDRIRGYV